MSQLHEEEELLDVDDLDAAAGGLIAGPHESIGVHVEVNPLDTCFNGKFQKIKRVAASNGMHQCIECVNCGYDDEEKKSFCSVAYK